MKKKSLSLKVSPAIGKVSLECFVPDQPRCVMTFAHGAGAGMWHEFMVNLSTLLAGHNIATIRFNFPFTENKKGRPDTPAVAHQTIAAVIEKTKKLFPGLPIFVSGKSFGGRMTSQLLAGQPDPVIKGVVFFGFPLHQPGKPSMDRAEHLRQVQTPMLFLQGTRDELAKWDLIEELCSSLKKATLIKIEGANHAFKAGKQDILSLLAENTSNWIAKKMK
jgi:predicted alpha/beta-hydrolase family hydrolase